MMTMASLTADGDPPWPNNNLIYTAMPAQPLQELTALKDDTHGIDLLQNHHPTILREIPTRISPSAPTDAVIDRHDAN